MAALANAYCSDFAEPLIGRASRDGFGIDAALHQLLTFVHGCHDAPTDFYVEHQHQV
jgi:hypothetical protein